MKNYVVESYENYKEEDRLSTNNARKIEFITTTKVFDELISGKKKILDCAAGTGVYTFYLADKGHDVTATDITPRHIEIIRNTAKNKPYDIDAMVLDATNMSVFEDESFDVVLNMGPFYHLVNESDREKCFEESLRVLKKGGLLITAYIPRYYVFQYIAMKDERFLDTGLAKQLVNTGELHHDDEKCFWTDTYYATAHEMEQLFISHNMRIVDHFAQDGATSHFADIVDNWDDEQFKIWCDYHYSVCREKTILGASNHAIIVGEK